MKKLLLLTGVAMLTAAASGCERLHFFRGARANPCCDPAPVCAPACDPCAGGGGPVIGAPMVAPGPAPDGYAQ